MTQGVSVKNDEFRIIAYVVEGQKGSIGAGSENKLVVAVNTVALVLAPPVVDGALATIGPSETRHR